MTVSIMEGERRLRANRKRFWGWIGKGVLLAMGMGAIAGFLRGSFQGWHAGETWIGWMMWPVLAGSAVLFVWFCREYFRRVDELDLQDNLWSSLIGFYAFFMALPAWALLHEVHQLPAPDVWTLWGLSAVAITLAYGWRKLRTRF